jgi:hypothetical protein
MIDKLDTPSQYKQVMDSLINIVFPMKALELGVKRGNNEWLGQEIS